jgi:hypothetical protein
MHKGKGIPAFAGMTSWMPKKSPGQVAGAFLQSEAVKTDSLCDDA